MKETFKKNFMLINKINIYYFTLGIIFPSYVQNENMCLVSLKQAKIWNMYIITHYISEILNLI